MSHSADRLRHKLRQLKKQELAIRFQTRPMPERHTLIWDSFFSIEPENASVKYPFAQLLELEHGQLKQVLDEYLFRVYFENYQENGLRLADIYDPKLLSLLGLPPHSGSEEIRHRLQELVEQNDTPN